MRNINYFKYQSRVHFDLNEAMIVITEEHNIDLTKKNEVVRTY